MTDSHSDPRPAGGRAISNLLGFLDRHPTIWLALGTLLLAGSQLRFGVGALAWVAPIPFLRYSRSRSGWRSGVALGAAAFIGWTLAVAKIATAPLPLAMSVLFSAPIALALTMPYFLARPIRRQLGERGAVLGFAALMVAGEWMLHTALPFGVWGAAANTQLEHLDMLQLASITGLHGVSFLVYFVAASAESLLALPSRRQGVFAAAAVALVAAVVVLGEVRLAVWSSSGVEQSRVAAVGTDSTVGTGPLPDAETSRQVEAGLFARTREAARAGASLVVWTEAATLVRSDDEAAFLARVGNVARELGVVIAAGYVVPLAESPLTYRNRYAMIMPEGTVAHVYDKHHPVPGEPAVAGTAPMPLYTHPELGRVSGAICYDYDFPRLGLAHADLDLDLVVLPASDWRGIDPIHTEMAALRAIEGGHSIVRSTRFGLSAGIDPYGRIRGSLSHFDGPERVLVMSLPRRGIGTVYGAIGDVFPISCTLFGLGAFAVAVLRRSRSKDIASRYKISVLHPYSTETEPVASPSSVAQVAGHVMIRVGAAGSS
ncbi:MAG: nitrilase-related carbon-nitrogen hydrolase [Kofleriaceae bacterium]